MKKFLAFLSFGLLSACLYAPHDYGRHRGHHDRPQRDCICTDDGCLCPNDQSWRDDRHHDHDHHGKRCHEKHHGHHDD